MSFLWLRYIGQKRYCAAAYHTSTTHSMHDRCGKRPLKMIRLPQNRNGLGLWARSTFQSNTFPKDHIWKNHHHWTDDNPETIQLLNRAKPLPPVGCHVHVEFARFVGVGGYGHTIPPNDNGFGRHSPAFASSLLGFDQLVWRGFSRGVEQKTKEAVTDDDGAVGTTTLTAFLV